MNVPSVKFNSELLDDVLSGEKKTTWRVWEKDWEKSKLTDPGQFFTVQSANGDKVGLAQVKWIKRTTIGLLTQEDKKYHEEFSDVESIIEELSRYYPDKNITPSTQITVIRFKVLADEGVL